MTDQEAHPSPIRWLAIIIAIIVLTGISVFLDIPVLGLILGFIFLTFIPGFLILNIFRLNRLGMVETIVISVGISVAFTIILGLILNGLLLAIGYARPLSTSSLIISFGSITFILAIIAYLRNRSMAFAFTVSRPAAGEMMFLMIPSLFPLLSIIGMRIMNLSDNNTLLMVLLFLIPAYIIFLAFQRHRVPERVYPATILFISISLLLMYSLRSNHIIGSDVHREYFIYLTTIDNLKWGQLGLGLLDSCISNSLLPAIYQNFLGIDPEYLYKLFYSALVSVLPLVVYALSRKYVGSFYAFLVAVFITAQISFLSTPAATRTNIAILFFGLMVLVMFHDAINGLSKRALLIIFSAAVILSHYGATFVAFFVLFFVWLVMEIFLRVARRTQDSKGGARTRLGRSITFTFVFIFLAMLFFWHSQMTTLSFDTGVRFIYESLKEWQWFLDEEVGGQAVQAAFGHVYSYTSTPQIIELVFSWLTVALLSIGLLTVFLRFRTMVSTPFTGRDKPEFLHNRFETEYLVLSAGCFLLVGASVIIPNVSEWYGTARVYFQMVIPLSVFLVIGGIEIARYVKVKPHWLILAILLPYFLCTTGAMTQMFHFPRAITLNSEGPLYYMYITDEESHSAKWLKEYNEEGTKIFSKDFSSEILISQGQFTRSGMPGTRVFELEQVWEKYQAIDGYVYLRSSDIAGGWLLSEYPEMFADKNLIYTNGKSQVYKSHPLLP